MAHIHQSDTEVRKPDEKVSVTITRREWLTVTRILQEVIEDLERMRKKAEGLGEKVELTGAISYLSEIREKIQRQVEQGGS
ncbi:MAG: hypothetical protein DRO04_03090 [Candidatus Iainarchaeum archaeon]|uniref:Uncharacterized protein n=1 Tax=Candidatus Iainarchaeum sp. TaxID=3101447 RepID=A0A497JGJ5_9ARCH|nr:MAG: hypothetical protein DRO04_03090 [Candidatus Diapherotrites archaeon]